MKYLYMMLLLLIGFGGTALAQQIPVRVVDSVLFKTDDARDQPIYRVFGFSTSNTDGDDSDEVWAPFFPPAPSFFMVFTDFDLGNNLYDDPLQNDIRGLPDSVANEMASRFWMEYEIHFERGYGQNVSMVFPARLARGIDSINIQDVEGLGNVFNYTYAGSDRATEFKLTNNELRYVRMRVYYNIVTASVDTRPVIAQSMQLFPNPARPGEGITLTGDAPAGSRIMVSDMLGRTVETRPVFYRGERLRLDLASASAGAYMVSLIGSGGEVLYRRELMLVR
jgi:hypothetical protein